MSRRFLFVVILCCLAFQPAVSHAEDGATMLRDYVKGKSPGIFVIMPNGDIRLGPVSGYHHDLAGGPEKVKDCVRGLIEVKDGKVAIQWFPPTNEMQRGNLRWIDEVFVKDYLEKLCKRTEGLRTALSGATLKLPSPKGGIKEIPLGQLLGGGDELEKRVVRVVQESGHISSGEADEAIWVIDEGQEMKPRVAEKVKKARKEIMAISAGAQVDLEKGVDMDRLMEDWRKTRPGAQLQSPTPELKKIVRDIKDTPSGELKMLGLREPEIKFQAVIKERLERASVMQGLREKLPLRLEKKGLSPRVFQSKLREIMFNPTQLELGGADGALGAFDVGASVAAGLVQTYDILFNRNLSPEQESLELGNAWVTTLPVVGDFAQGLITGGQGWYEGDKGKLLEAGLWVSIGIMGCIPGGQLPAVIASISLATKPLVAGVYDARQAQNLVQAWVESGDWAMDQKPRKLKGLFDREGKVHAITYEDLLTEKGNTPYKSEMADGLLGIDVTMNDSIRDYAEKYVMPQYTAITSLRDGLKSLYPDFDDKVWKDEFTAKYKIEARGGKGGLALFNTYYVIRTKAFQQTIAQLKTWAEDEMRAAKDYDAEVARLKGELQALQDELKCTTLIGHADGSVEAYSRVIKNLWEQESLPLSKMRIYEHYVKTYSAIAGKLRRVNDLFRECSAPYVPSSWHLTGFPEFDVDRVNTLLSSMENGRKSVVEYIEKLLKDFDQPVTKYDPSNECHKKAFDVLAPLRYKVAFVENMILYYKQLAEGSSTWTSAYDSAASRYKESRDGISTSYKGKTLEIVSSQRFIDSFMTYVAAIPYSLASGEVELYRSTARDYEVRLPGDRKEYEMATWTTGTGGKTLQGCLLAGLKVELTLSPREPEEGQNVTARVRLTGGTPPKENYWHWKTSGGITASSRAGQEITLRVASEGTVTVELLDHFDTKLAKVLTTASASVRPKKKDDKKDDKKDGKDDKKGGTGSPAVPAKWKFSGVSSGNWTAAYTEKGIRLERKPAKIKAPCGWDATVTATVWAEFPAAASGKDDPKSPSDCLAAAQKAFQARRQGDTPNDMAVGLFLAGGVEGANSFSLGDFQGAMADFALWMRRGSGGMFGYSGSYFGAGGRGTAVKNGMVLRFGYNVGGGGCWDNSDRAYLVTQGVAAQAEAQAILKSLSAGPDGEIKQEPYKGPNYDGSDLPKVTLSPPKLEKLRVGNTVKITAEVHNAKPEDSPFTYNWGGTFDGKPEDAKKKASITVKPERPGKYDLSVSVDGQRFNMGSASLQYEVADYKVKIERVPPDSKPVPVGVKTGFKAILTVDGKPADGPFIYRWQPHPEVAFDRLDSDAPGVNAAFPKPGRVKVWVQVLEKREGREATVAESEQLEIEVIKPQLELVFEPKEPFVGQEVRAKLTVKPEVKEIDFRWMPVPGNAKQTMESKDGREITFTLKDDRPAEIHVMARVPGSGEDLGEAKGTVKAKKYTVGVTGPKAYGPKPKIWKEGVGLVDVENAIAVDQVVEFAADVQPQPQTGPVKYEWRVGSGPCRVSNPIVRETRVTAGEAGSCALVVVARDRNDVELGTGAGSFNATVTRETIAAGQKKAKDVADAKTKLAGAKGKARKGDYDGAIRDAEEAAKLDPANKDAADTAGKLRTEKETIHQQIGKAKKLMDENKFADAQKELIVASNLNSYYPPVQQANQELGTRWNKYNAEVRDKVYEVRSANEKKDFDRALAVAAAWRASTKLDPYADRELKQQEDWAKQWKAQKDRQIGILKEAGRKVRSYDYAGALKQYDEGFANGQNLYNGTEPEYREAVELRSQAYTKNKRLQELIPWVRKAAEDKEYLTVDALNNTLKTADEAIALQPNNEQLRKWREQIAARAEKTKADNERIAAGRKLLDAAGGAERAYLTNESSIQARQLQWDEKLEEQQQIYLTTAIQNYRASLQYIPDAAVEKKIKELEAALEGRKKHLENYRLSRTLMAEADELYRQAAKDPDIVSASPKYDEAAAKYRKSLSLYRPFNAENVEKTISAVEYYKHERWVKKHWADGQALEKEAKYTAALAAYDRAIASFHPTVAEKDRMWAVVHAQDLRNRINGAKNWRADGEAKQKAGKIAEAIASYRQSLKLLPDPALEGHVRMLEGKQAEAGQRKAAAEKLWQEGTALFNQGRPSEALAKFKESLGYGSDASRQKYVADLEARRAKAVALREQGAALQGQNRIPEAIARYKESLTHWPDPALAAHITALEKSLAGVKPPTGVPGGADGTWEVSFNNYHGKMELQRSAGGWSGRLWLDAHRQWEQLTNISYDPGTGRLEFTRPISGATQRYSGILSGDRLEGTFTQQNSSSKYTWRAKRTAAGAAVTAGSGSTESSPVTTSAYYHVDLTPYGGKKGTPRKVKNIEVDDGSWVRLKATHEKKLRLDIPLPAPVAASAVAVVSNLDNAHNVPDKMTTTVLTVHTTSGDRSFELKAGVHSSEWNRGETSGATHAWPKETNIGGPRWMAVFSLPAGSVVTGLRFDHRDTDKKYYHGDAAPGFCLRGVTLVRAGGAAAETTVAGTAGTAAGAATTPPSAWADTWRSDPGPDGEVVTFSLSQSGTRLTGTFQADVPYTSATGARQKESFRGTLEGTVSGSRVTGTFREGSDKQPTGSFVFTMDGSGNLFTAVVRGEDTSDTYTVRRGGSAASSGALVSSGQATARAVTAEITNRSRENTHIFTDGETFGPANRLAPGEKRRVAVTMKSDGSVTFKAGRDGKVMATKTWRGTPGDTTRVPVVVFDDTNPYDKLTVTTGLR